MSEEGTSWYSSGFGGIKGEEDRLASMYGPPKLWLKAGATKSIVFVDDNPACLHEHSPKINGSWGNSYTCLRDMYPDDVACCEILGQDTRHFVGYFTVIDMDQWKDKKGNLHEFEIKLLPAKVKSLKMIEHKKVSRENRLAGRIFNIRRTDDKSPSIGDDYEYNRDVKDPSALFASVQFKGKKLSEFFTKSVETEEGLAKLKKTFAVTYADGVPVPKLVPFSYQDILRPKTPKDLRDILRGAKIEKNGPGSTNSTGSDASSNEKDVPF